MNTKLASLSSKISQFSLRKSWKFFFQIHVSKSAEKVFTAVLGFILLLPITVIAQSTTQTFSTSGSFTGNNGWLVPAGVTSITVECWGAGGGGGGSGSSNRGGSGGAGGAYVKKVLTVTPNTRYDYSVGAGGAGGTGNIDGSAGGSTWFSTTSTIFSEGGLGGLRGSVSNASGAAGSSSSSIGDVGFVFRGGNGGNAQNAIASGGGGGGAGSAGNGGDASNATAGIGTSLFGGTGGTGVSTNSNGSPGSATSPSNPSYGGGGSGAYRTSGNRVGGAGRQGYMQITYTLPTIASFTPLNKCEGSSASVTITGTNFTGASSVTFGGTSVSFIVNSATSITASVPATGITTGAIVVTNGGNFGTSASNFIVDSPSGGTIASSQSICSGSTPVGLTQSVASTGAGTLTYQWQSSTVSDFSSGVTTIGGATLATYSPGALTTTTYYRRLTTSTLNSVACGPVASNIIEITVTGTPNTSGLTFTAATTTCSGSGVSVQVNGPSLGTNIYNVTYTFDPSNGPAQTYTSNSVSFIGGVGTFTTVPLTSASADIDIININCSAVTVLAQTSTESPLPSSAISITASTADIGNPNGSTISIRSKNLTAGTTYTVNYTLVGINGNSYPSTPGTTSVTMANQSKGNTKLGTFITGQLITSGDYRITINSIAFASTGCSIATTATTTFTIQSGFFTQTSGSWNTPAVWGGAGTGPNSNDGAITISVGDVVFMPDTISLSNSWSLDQLTIYGTLRIESDMTLSILDGLGTDIIVAPGGKLEIGTTTNTGTVNGTLIFEEGVSHTVPSSSDIEFKVDSKYRHLSTVTEGTPPLATWASTSTFEVAGYTSSNLIFSSPNWSQNFANFTWNCTAQTGDININSLLGSSPTTTGNLQGNVTIQSTGTGIVRFGDDDYSLTIPGTLSVNGSARFSTGPSNGNGPDVILNIANFTYSSSAASWVCEAGQATVNISGNIQVNSGTVFLSDGGGNVTRSGATINLAGDLTVVTGATLDASSSNSNRTALLNYNNLPASNAAKTHLHTVTGSIIGYMQYRIVSNQTVRTVNESPISSLRTNAGTFTMEDGSVLIVESTDVNGAVQSGTTAGNLRVPDAGRAFTSGSTIEYGRTFTAAGQFIGSGHPITGGVDCRINNVSGVTVSSTGGTVTIGGDLLVIGGNLTVGENNVTVLQNTETITGNVIIIPRAASATTTFRADGAIIMTGGNIQMNSSATVNASNDSLLINGDLQGTNFFSFTGANNQVTIGGVTRTFTRDFPISETDTLESLTMNVTGGNTTLVIPQNLRVGNFTTSSSTYSGGLRLTSGNVDMNANLVVTTDLTMTSGTLFFEGDSVELQRNIQPSATGLFSADALSTLSITGTFSGDADSLLFTPTGNTLGTLILNRSANLDPNIFIDTPITIANFLYLTDGNFFNESGLTMAENATIVRTPESSFYTGSAIPTGGPYNIIYNSHLTSSIETGLESQGYIFNITSNVNDASVENNIDIHGTLDVTTGTFDADGAGENRVFTLRSTNDAPDSTANVAPLGGTITGDITVQRYMSPELRMYRYISSPVSDATLEDWMDDFPVTGGFLDPSTQAQWGTTICGLELKSRSTSMYYYDESVVGNNDDGYRPFPTQNTFSQDNPLVVGVGYVPFIRECGSPTIIDVRGKINHGPIDLKPSFTDHNKYPFNIGDGWNLIGNPYPSAIQWNSGSWTKTNISPVVSIRDNGSGMMRYYDGTGGSTFDGIITSGQAFWVRATAINPVLIIQEGAKVNTQGHEFYRTGNEGAASKLPTISISLKSSGLEDIAFIRTRENAQTELDDWDAPKLKNELFGISTVTPQGTKMAINTVPPQVKEGYIIPLKMDDVSQGECTLQFKSSNDFREYSIELMDHLTGIRRVLNWDEVFTFTAASPELNKDRFTAKLTHLQKSEIKVVELVAYPNPVRDVLTVQLPPDGFAKTLAVFDQRGVKIEDRLESPYNQISEISFTSKPSGVYLIRLVGPGYNLLTKVIKD